MASHCRLLRLPGELIHQILGLCSRSELVAVCRVCHSLQGLVTPKLYEVIEILYHPFNPTHPDQLILFLRTILHDPQRAFYVKALGLNTVPPGVQDYNGLATLDHETQQLARTALAHSQHPNLTQTMTTLGSGGEDSIDAVVALLVSLLSRLKIIQLDYLFRPWSIPAHCTNDAEIMMQLRSTPGMIRTENLRLLREIYMVNDGVSDSAEHTIPPLFNPLRLLCLPGIESIECRILEYQSSFQWPILEPFQPSLTTLILRFSCIRPQTLRELLAITPNLKRLEYHCAINFESNIALDGHKVLNCWELYKAIDTVSATLTELKLSLEFYALEAGVDESAGDHVEWGIRDSLGNMSKFQKLRTLHVPFVMLLGWSCDASPNLDILLPSSLSELGLSSDMTGWYNWDWERDVMVQHITSFLHRRSGSLSKFILREDRGLGMFVAYRRATIQSLGHATGVEIEWVRNHFDL